MPTTEKERSGLLARIKASVKNNKPKSGRYMLILSMLVLSALGFAGVCSDSCSEAHKYTFLLVDINAVGIGYCLSLGAALLLRDYGKAKWLYPALLAGCVGAEIWLMTVQVRAIGHFCILCTLFGVAVVGLLVLELIAGWRAFVAEASIKGRVGSILRQIALTVPLFVGFTVAMLGVGREAGPVAGPMGTMEVNVSKRFDFGLGNKSSDTSVYIVTDWFCPACAKAEPVIERLYPKLTAASNVFFIDMIIHSGSLEFMPYNTQFLVSEKTRYIEIRKALFSLAARKPVPSIEDVAAAVKPLGVAPEPVKYRDALYAMLVNQQVTKALDITSTPTVVVANRRTGKVKKLVGGEIKEAAVVAAIEATAL